MRIELAITLMLIFITIYAFLVRIYSILFRLTGLTKTKSKFQAISLLTNSGYTTSEAEIITTNNVRRNIAMASMITGYIFSVIIISLVLNLINSLSVNNYQVSFLTLIIVFSVFLFILVFFKLPFIRKPLEKLLENLAKKIMQRGMNDNVITLLDSYGKEAIAQIDINVVPAPLVGKKLFEVNARDMYHINILILKRNGVPVLVNGETILNEKDVVVVFGSPQGIKKLFVTNKEENKD